MKQLFVLLIEGPGVLCLKELKHPRMNLFGYPLRLKRLRTISYDLVAERRLARSNSLIKIFRFCEIGQLESQDVMH